MAPREPPPRRRVAQIESPSIWVVVGIKSYLGAAFKQSWRSMIYRLIAPDWLKEQEPTYPKVREGEFDSETVDAWNRQGYNAYFLPNYPKTYADGTTVNGSHIDTFEYVFVDMDMKSSVYESKEEFIQILQSETGIAPSTIVDSGNGVHAYWRVTDLDAMSYLKLQRRLMRKFQTDEAVATIYQLMRVPGTVNQKKKDEPKDCQVVFSGGPHYTCEELDNKLPTITQADATYCEMHYNKTYNIGEIVEIDDKLPLKFCNLIKTSQEAKELFAGNVDDRSKADWRLAHLMYVEGFTKAEASSVLVNCRKAIERSPIHRVNYATNIVDKIWLQEQAGDDTALSASVKDILKRSKSLEGSPLRCWDVFSGTETGFKLTQVMGLVGASGSGKTTLALNYFYWFAKKNPEYVHMFVSLEQPEVEIASRWVKMCGDNEALYEKVHVLGNYNADGSYRNLSLEEIKNYIIEFKAKHKQEVGCVVIDHIGILRQENKKGDFSGIIDICHKMKSFAIETNTFLLMQSQTSRDKAGQGDLELDKDAAYGTTMFEWYCDWVITTWQPLKRVYPQAPQMTCSAFKNCKIRHKNTLNDKMKEDSVYVLMFDPATERLRQKTQDESKVYDHWDRMATQLRNKDRKREPTRVTEIDWAGDDNE